MQTFNLKKQAKKLKKMFEKNGISVRAITIENDFLKAVRSYGDVRYFTPDLKHFTEWETCRPMEIENGFIKLTHNNGVVRYYTTNLKQFTRWAESITMENDIVKTYHRYEGIHLYTPDLEVFRWGATSSKRKIPEYASA